MKYAVFFMGLFLVVPAGALLSTYSRRFRDALFVVMIISTAFINKIDINFIDRWWYHGTTRAIEISFIDFFSVMLLMGILMSMRRDRFRPFWPTSLGLMILFLGYACLNVLISDPKLFGFFELSKMVRGLIAFLAIVFYIRSEREVRLLLVTLSFLLIYEGSLAVWQRYITGTMRVTGSLIHPSQLANYCCLLAPVVLAGSFSKIKPQVQVLCGIAWVFACVAAILSITRMGVATIMVTSAGMLCVQMTRGMNWKKGIVIVLGCLVAGGLFIRGFDKVASRHEIMSAAEDAGNTSAGRKIYYTNALDMARKNPFGVGLNNWSYYMSAQEGTPYDGTDVGGEGPRAIMGHSAYALTLGELGWPGIIIFLALWCQWFWIAGEYIFVRSTELLPQIVLGCFFAILASNLSAFTEHNYRNQLFYIVFNLILGLAVAVSRLHKHSGSTQTTHMRRN